MKTTGILNSAKNLRKLLLDNPDLPLLVFAGEDANIGDWSYMSCSSVRAEVGEVLDCSETPRDGKIYTKRNEFEEDLADVLSGDFKGTDKEFDELLTEEIAKYDKHWTECILVYADN